MKRDPDLVRAILQAIEADDRADGHREVHVAVEGYSDEEIAYHFRLMIEGGLLEGSSFETTAGTTWQVRRLTSAGHDFLDLSRDQTRWNRAKKFVKDRLGVITFDALKAVLLKMALEAIGR